MEHRRIMSGGWISEVKIRGRIIAAISHTVDPECRLKVERMDDAVSGATTDAINRALNTVRRDLSNEAPAQSPTQKLEFVL